MFSKITITVWLQIRCLKRNHFYTEKLGSWKNFITLFPAFWPNPVQFHHVFRTYSLFMIRNKITFYQPYSMTITDHFCFLIRLFQGRRNGAESVQQQCSVHEEHQHHSFSSKNLSQQRLRLRFTDWSQRKLNPGAVSVSPLTSPSLFWMSSALSPA